MKEQIEKYLLSIGTDASTMEAFRADVIPDDYNQDEAVKGYLAKRRELTLNDGDLQKELKKKYNSEMYPAMMKPILKELQKVTGLSSEQLKSITQDGQSLPDMKKAIALGIETFGKTAAGGVDEVKQELFAIKAQLETSQSEHATNIENLQNGFNQERKRSKVTRHFEKVVSGLDLTVPNVAANTLLTTDLMNKYNFDVNDKGELEVFTKEGNKVANDKGFLSASEVIKSRANDFTILKKSNGGGNGSGGSKGSFTPQKGNEGESDRIKRMREAANRD